MSDIKERRKDFPILEQVFDGNPLCYLDSAASAQRPRAVMGAMREAETTAYANVHRGLHRLANKATENFEGARVKLQHFINAAEKEEVIWTSNATAGINLVASSFLSPRIEAGDEIILSPLEHHSNIVPWHFLRERQGAVLRWLDINEAGEIDVKKAEQLFTPKTKMLALTQTSNVLGIHTPLRALTALAHSKNVPVLVDGCQGIVHQPTDVQALDCDFYVFSAHKLYGPNGIGVLYGKRALLETMRPFQGGGEMIDEVQQDHITYGALPYRFEAGTPAIVEAVGFGAAIDYIQAVGVEKIRNYESALYEEMVSALETLKPLKLLAARVPGKAPILSFTTDLAHPHDIAQLLDQQGVAVRAGHHCAQPLMAHLGIPATARASLAFYNNSDDIARLAKALEITLNFFI